MDRFLDQAREGPTWLKQEPIARLVVDALWYAAQRLGHYDLHAYVVMANHVHVLIFPKVKASKLMQSVKGFTAREANKILHRTAAAEAGTTAGLPARRPAPPSLMHRGGDDDAHADGHRADQHG